MSERWPELRMRLHQWMVLIGVVVGVGWLKVAQRNAILVNSYAVGDRMHHLLEEETDVVRLDADVVTLTSPVALAQMAKERRLTLVAWSTVDRALPQESRQVRSTGPLMQIAVDERD